MPVDVTPEQKAACEVIKLVRKLRWIGLDAEAKELQLVLKEFSPERRGSMLACPHSTD
jgi:hypothetical protein